MNITSSSVEGATEIKMITAVTTCGIGFFTLIAFSFCNLFGIECQMYDRKIDKAKKLTASKLITKAKEAGATGIMNVRLQVDRTTVHMYGMAYKK